MNHKKVLIAEDNPETAELIAQVAADLGCDVRLVETADDFAQTIQDFRPDALVLDLMMPDTDGIRLLRHLAQTNSRAKVILASGSHPQIVNAARRLGDELELGMVGVLQKPFTIVGLESMLCRALDIRHRVTAEDLRSAIADREIMPFFQPMVGTDSEHRQVMSLEALARWIRPDYGLILPRDFIPPIEQSALIEDMTWLIIDEVTTNLQFWRENGFNVSCAVNLSPRMLTDLSLPDRLAQVLAEKRLSPSFLTLAATRALADAASEAACPAFDCASCMRALASACMAPWTRFPERNSNTVKTAASTRMPTYMAKISRLERTADSTSVDGGIGDWVDITIIAFCIAMVLAGIAAIAEFNRHVRVITRWTRKRD